MVQNEDRRILNMSGTKKKKIEPKIVVVPISMES
jgi:hypothetical protein